MKILAFFHPLCKHDLDTSTTGLEKTVKTIFYAATIFLLDMQADL